MSNVREFTPSRLEAGRDLSDRIDHCLTPLSAGSAGGKVARAFHHSHEVCSAYPNVEHNHDDVCIRAEQGEGYMRILSLDCFDHAEAESGTSRNCAQHEDRRELSTLLILGHDSFGERDESGKAPPRLLYGIFDRRKLGQVNLLRRWGRAHA